MHNIVPGIFCTWYIFNLSSFSPKIPGMYVHCHVCVVQVRAKHAKRSDFPTFIPAFSDL